MSEISRHLAARDRKVMNGRLLFVAPAIVLIMAAAFGPLVIVLVYSFLHAGPYGGVVWAFSGDAWLSTFLERDIFDGSLSVAWAHVAIFWRSIKLALLTTGLTLILGFPTAYFIATRPPHTRDTWLFLITIPFWTNLLIRTFAVLQIIRNEGLVNQLLLRLGVISAPLQILYTDTAILLGMAYVYLPLMVLPLYATIEKLDFRLLEAAYDLYATRFRVLLRIVFPLVKSGLLAGSILVFVPAIGAYVTPIVLGGGKNMMLSNLIELQFGAGRNWPLGAALSLTVVTIAMVAFCLLIKGSRTDEALHG